MTLPTDEQLAEIIHRLLVVGVPPTALAKGFDLPVADLKALQSQIRIASYGTDELTEAMTFLIWDAYNASLELMHEGPPSSRMRMVSLILSRSMQLAGRQPPETLDRMREMLLEMAKSMETTDTPREPGPYVQGKER